MADGTISPDLATPMDFSACEAEPIRTSGMLQSYGCLLVLGEPDGAIEGFGANASVMLGRALAAGQAIDEALGHAVWLAVQKAMACGSPACDPRLVDLDEAAPALDLRFETLVHRSGDHLLVEFTPRQAAPAAVAPITLDETRMDLFRLSARAVDQIRLLTGYDRVMIYRFHPDWTGEVIAEIRRPSMTPYLGLRYPATDIPSQARALFAETLVRQIADVGAAAVTLTSPNPLLDLSHAVLRSASPYHLEYLKNMGVGASFTLSILVKGALWGLIACHHETPRQIPHESQYAALALAADLAGRIEILERNEASTRRKSIDKALRRWRKRLAKPGRAKLLLSHLADMMVDLRAQGVAAVCGEACLCVGATPDINWLIEAASVLKDRAPPGNVMSTDHLAATPGLSAPPDGIAGALVVVLPGAPTIALFVFRTALVKEVHWGGDPARPALVSPEDGKMSPRHSFTLWRELVRDRSQAWSEQKRDVFSFIGNWLAEGQRQDPAGFAMALKSDLAELAEAYIRPGDTHQLLVDILPEGIGVLLWTTGDLGTGLMHANRAFTAMFGLEPGELDGQGSTRVLEHTQMDPSVFANEVGAEQEIDIWSPTRGALRARVRREYLVRYLGPKGVRTVESLLVSDVTGVSRAHEALIAAVRHADEAEGTRKALLRNMSHELRTPLNAIMGYSDLIAEQLLGPLGQEGYVQAAQEIRTGARHLVSLIDNTLEMARLREGKLDLNETQVDLRDIIDEAAHMLQPAADGQGVSLRWIRREAAMIAMVDPTAIRQIAINLINNAIKFTAKGGTVTVDLTRLIDGGVSLSVVDTGIGIPPEAIMRLFQPFSQVDSGRDRQLGGAGLGLSIVKSLAQLHGGSAIAQSVEGQGSTFTVTLPAWRIQAAA
jgi:light-regulated signal transduction histidine kinase (bacteriophytochrome)